MVSPSSAKLKNAGPAVRSLRALAAYVHSLGKEPFRLFEQVGVDPVLLFDSDARISPERFYDLWGRAEAFTGDPTVGLHAAEKIDFSAFEGAANATEYLLVKMLFASATVGEGLARVARYFEVSFSPARVDVVMEGGRAVVRLVAPKTQPLPRAFVEFSLGWIARAIRAGATRPVTPLDVRWSHPTEAPAHEYARILGVEARFSAAEDALVFDACDLEVPMRASAPATIVVLERRGEEMLAHLPVDDSLVDRVRAVIAGELRSGSPGLERVARALDISTRTLSRRLEEVGTSHKALLEEVRAELARHYLVDEHRSVSETADLLGFSDARAFRRAFRRWYGKPPVEYRPD